MEEATKLHGTGTVSGFLATMLKSQEKTVEARQRVCKGSFLGVRAQLNRHQQERETVILELEETVTNHRAQEDCHLENILPTTQQQLFKAGLLAYTCNPSTQEAEAGRPPVREQQELLMHTQAKWKRREQMTL